MTLLLFTNWWTALAWQKQAFWSLAIVATILLVIRLLASLLDTEEETPALSWLDSRFILLFFTGLGWSGLLIFHNTYSLINSLIWSVVIGLLLSAAARWLYLGRKQRTPPRRGELLITGEVLQPIPPHRNGFGKVQLISRRLPYEIDAITAGQEIPRGTPVRVVEILDDRVILVEAIDHAGYPGQRPNTSA